MIFTNTNNGTDEGENTMLKEFSFSNSYSFQDAACLTMEADHALKDNCKFVRIRGKDDGTVFLNTVAAIYGANAGGKTNIIRALSNAVTNIYNGFGVRNMQFALTETRDAKYTHRLVIVRGDTEYEYSYTATSTVVVKEEFIYRNLTNKNKSETVFTRDGGVISSYFPAGSYQDTILRQAAANNKILVIKTAGDLLLEPFVPFYNWCGSVVSVTKVHGEKERQDALDKFALVLHEDKEKLNKFSEFINSLDKSIRLMETIAEKPKNDKTIESSIQLAAVHACLGTRGEDIGFLFPLELESNGTKKLMELYPDIEKAITEGSTFICDEIDASLHPNVFKELVRMFNQEKTNPKGAQLVFTAHNTVVMNRECLRRDQLHFVEKDEHGKSSIFRLSDVVDENGNKIRMDAKYDKLYLEGLIGATHDDFLSSIL